MKNFLEKLSTKHVLLISVYILTIFLYVYIFGTEATFFSIFINPFFFFGIPCLILNHLRYKELKRTYKNYPINLFIEVYKKAPDFSYGKDVIYSHNFLETTFYDQESINQLKPLAKNMLSIYNKSFFPNEELAEAQNSLENFITQKYLNKFKSLDFISATILALYFQLMLWQIV